MKAIKEIRSQLNDLYLVRSSLNKEVKEVDDISVKEQLTAVNNQIMILQWVLTEKK